MEPAVCAARGLRGADDPARRHHPDRGRRRAGGRYLLRGGGLGCDKQSWSIDIGFLDGDTADPSNVVWAKLDEVHERRYQVLW